MGRFSDFARAFSFPRSMGCVSYRPKTCDTSGFIVGKVHTIVGESVSGRICNLSAFNAPIPPPSPPEIFYSEIKAYAMRPFAFVILGNRWLVSGWLS